MLRKIIHIDESKCDGCGLCAQACHEGAIQMVDGVARLTREDYCDGLGDCLPACPTGAHCFKNNILLRYMDCFFKIFYYRTDFKRSKACLTFAVCVER